MIVTCYDRLITISTHWLDKDLSNCLPVVPLCNTAGYLLQEVFMVLQDLWDLVKYLIHKERVHDGATVWLFEGTHVTLKGQHTGYQGQMGTC